MHLDGRDSILQLVALQVEPQVPEHSVIRLELLHSPPGLSLLSRLAKMLNQMRNPSRRSMALRQGLLVEMNPWPAILLLTAIVVGLIDQTANTSTLLCRRLRRNQHRLSHLSLNRDIHTPQTLNEPVELMPKQARVKGQSSQARGWVVQQPCAHLQELTHAHITANPVLPLADLEDIVAPAPSPDETPITMIPPARVTRRRICPNRRLCPRVALDRTRSLPTSTSKEKRAPAMVRPSDPFPLEREFKPLNCQMVALNSNRYPGSPLSSDVSLLTRYPPKDTPRIVPLSPKAHIDQTSNPPNQVLPILSSMSGTPSIDFVPFI